MKRYAQGASVALMFALVIAVVALVAQAGGF